MKKQFIKKIIPIFFCLLFPIISYANSVETIKYINGDIYTGELQNGVFNGWGTYTFAGDGKYEGNFFNGSRNGQGTFTWGNGLVYNGLWENGAPNGQGTLTYGKGKVVGLFEDGKVNGLATNYLINGDKYEGMYLDGSRSGHGKYTDRFGNVCEGEFRNGKMNGYFICNYANGDRVEGDFLDNEMSGHIDYISQNGNLSGYYYKGQLVRTDNGICTGDVWDCGDWSTCANNGTQIRSCNILFNCSTANTPSPSIIQNCTAPEIAPLKSDEELSNSDNIIKATVKLICFIDENTASQGSGTVIEPSGIILTNKHVIDNTVGCLVGFINNYSDKPYFNERQIADILKISSTEDVAILKIRNPQNKNLNYINIASYNINDFTLGRNVMVYGYPARFGDTITYTSGDFSGVDGNYYKTTAILEHGNSGGGAYFKDGTFVGIPSAVEKGELNSMGYILSIGAINNWLNNNNYASLSIDTKNNTYSRVSNIVNNYNIENFSFSNSNTNQSTNTAGIDPNLSKRLGGKILLQVESHGEAWYVNPKDNKIYYMANGGEAYRIMRYLGVGITDKDLNKVKNDKNFAKKNSGKIFLQVEAHGEAYYIDFNGSAHYLKDGSAAYTIMRELGLGITNNDLNKISEGSL